MVARVVRRRYIIGSLSEWVSEWICECNHYWLNEWVSKWECMHKWVIECMDEWEWVNGWMREWMSEWMDGWVNGWVNEWMSEWMEVNGWVNAILIESMSVHEWMCEWKVSEGKGGWVRDWLSEWVHCWISGWVSERVCEWVSERASKRVWPSVKWKGVMEYQYCELELNKWVWVKWHTPYRHFLSTIYIQAYLVIFTQLPIIALSGSVKRRLTHREEGWTESIPVN